MPVANCNMTKTETSLTCLCPTEERPLLPRWAEREKGATQAKSAIDINGFGFSLEPHDSETQQNGTSERLLLGSSSKDETRAYVVGQRTPTINGSTGRRTENAFLSWPGRVRRLIFSVLLELVAPSKVEGERRIIRHWPRFATNLIQPIARGLSSVLTDRVCFFSHCGTITIVWQAQDDLLNPERRAALSAGWACLEWSGTSGTAAHPGRGKVF
ncbi:hypothetical protein EDB92DRAFT_569582 [Lactarius akahatsu]|uniref:Uncharacterized protein n=1 Tax=Lactarius akahatsu TaxID=416441 RepID=A0AAD4LIU6_9AGAM|nr:hypothetical protein EDB92DRAFT_569582 [Lactarius akahatsu]